METRWGICGAGKISHDFSVAVKTPPLGDHQIMALAARSLERTQAFAQVHSTPRACGSYQDLADDPDTDPFAINLNKVKLVITASRKNNVFLMEPMWSRCLSVYTELDRLLVEDIMAWFAFSINVALPNYATITGTKGTTRVGHPIHGATILEVSSKQTQLPLPEPTRPLHFTNSMGLRYEALEVRQCLLKGLKESDRMMLADSELLAGIMVEVRRQVGVAFDQDLR
ncbi:trans-1,2-dihydrobenzene-1,2-diol dehydrogenase-like [Brachyhypopomus gauderio]|uniref:trans-1,2-dihydrobenzene-1,2-diol dehydrogenase-like n=1 Tax=Brachyhypopomus gauderio TaxID=698409 RepID=UPI004041693F